MAHNNSILELFFNDTFLVCKKRVTSKERLLVITVFNKKKLINILGTLLVYENERKVKKKGKYCMFIHNKTLYRTQHLKRTDVCAIFTNV